MQETVQTAPAPASITLEPERQVYHAFLHWLLVGPEHGVVRHVAAPEFIRQREAIEAVACLHARALQGNAVLESEWAAARAAARAAEAAAMAARARQADLLRTMGNPWRKP